MKTILLSLIAVFFSIAIYSQTPVPPGPISGTWTLAGSPYLIMGETTIDSGTTLTIEPGVLVEWQGSFTMFVQGQILAQGTEADSIIFTAANPDTGFRSIRFVDTPVGNDTSRFEYCVFKYGRVYGPWPDNCGGAIASLNYGKFIIDHCLFDHNTAVDYNIEYPGGGAIALYTSSPVIRNSKFINNVSYGGGAIVCRAESHPLIEYNLFTENTGDYGGAIMCYINSDPPIEHNLFYNNTAQHDGGAIELSHNCSPDIINNTIANNVAYAKGGGIDLYQGCSPTINNTILWGNTAFEGNQVYIYTADCVPDFYYSDIEGGVLAFGGEPFLGKDSANIDADPVFENPAMGDYTLRWGSPCIDTGDPNMTDPDGTRCDIGAFYFPHGLWIDRVKAKNSRLRIQCYPNPTDGIMDIRYRIPVGSKQLAVGSKVSLNVYYIHGKEIVNLVNEKQPVGEYQVRFDTSDLPSGIYLIRLQVGSKTAVERIIKF